MKCQCQFKNSLTGKPLSKDCPICAKYCKKGKHAKRKFGGSSLLLDGNFDGDFTIDGDWKKRFNYKFGRGQAEESSEEFYGWSRWRADAIKAFIRDLLKQERLRTLEEVMDLAKDHYWDSLSKDSSLIIIHLEALIAKLKGQDAK
jgi:hypothetical protein